MPAAFSPRRGRCIGRTILASRPAVLCVIPKLYDGRNKTFFFASFEGFRNRVGANDTILTVPTPEMYRGDFSNWVDQSGKLIPIYDPATQVPNASGSGFIRDVFPNNQIPAEPLQRADEGRFCLTRRVSLPIAAEFPEPALTSATTTSSPAEPLSRRPTNGAPRATR